MIIIGLTGPTGAGKTTVLTAFESQGAAVIDCDALYHRMVETDTDMLYDIEEHFPSCVTDGRVDRKALGNYVFDNPDLLRLLADITHKRILTSVREIIAVCREEGRESCVIDAIALFESGFDRDCDLTIGVLADPEIRITRIIERDGIAREYAEKRVKAQKPDEYYLERCTYILYNNGGREELTAKALLLYEEINKPDKKGGN